MMNKKQKLCWVIDAALGAGFLLTFFLDITGLAVHQWLGIFVGAGVVIHLLLHQKWLQTTARNFTTKATNRSRWYLIGDVLLGVGFLGIIVTGLVISTWANLLLENYLVWLTVHITVSIETLVILAIKLVSHWQWITANTRKIFHPVGKPSAALSLVSASSTQKTYDRREFLKLAGLVGAASALALVKAVNGLSDVSVGNNNTVNSDVLAAEIPDTEDIQAVTPVNTEAAIQSTQDVPVQTIQEATVDSVVAPVPTATQVVQQQASCVVRCPRACSFPGRCHKYTDSNNNQKCDLGECL